MSQVDAIWGQLDALRPKPAPRPPPKPRERAVYRAMTPGEVRLALALGRARFTPGTFDKRFCREVAAEAREAMPNVTERQAALLRRLVTRYRRQIRATDLEDADRYLLTPLEGKR